MDQNTKMLEQIECEITALTLPEKACFTLAEVKQVIKDTHTKDFLQNLKDILLEQRGVLLNDDASSVASDATLTAQGSVDSPCKNFEWQGVGYIIFEFQDSGDIRMGAEIYNDKIELIGTWDGSSIVFTHPGARDYHEKNKVLFTFPDSDFQITWKHSGKCEVIVDMHVDGACSSREVGLNGTWEPVGPRGDFRLISRYDHYMRTTKSGEWECDLYKSVGKMCTLRAVRHASLVV